jgi:hypothetical protein
MSQRGNLTPHPLQDNIIPSKNEIDYLKLACKNLYETARQIFIRLFSYEKIRFSDLGFSFVPRPMEMEMEELFGSTCFPSLPDLS